MEQTTNKIYARAKNGRVINFFSSVFEEPQDGDVLVELGNEDYHAHVHLKYQALDVNGCHNYKVVGVAVVPTTAEEKATEMVSTQTAAPISVLKAQLTATDYQAIKYAEGWMTEEEYLSIKTQRQAWRDEINQLEQSL